MSTMTKTFRGRTLEEVLPLVRAELGEDAVILERRELRDGGVGGFFQQRMVEVEAASGAAARAFAAELERAEEDLADGLSEAAPAPAPEAAAPAPAPAAPAHRPHVDARVTDVSVDDLFTAPKQDAGLKSLFAAGVEPENAPPAPQAAAEPEPAAAPAPAPAPEAVQPPPATAEPPAPQPAPASWTPPQLDAAPASAPAPQPEPAAAPAPPPAPASPVDGDALTATLTGRGMDPAVAAEVVAEAAERLAPLQPERPLRELVATALARRIPVARLGAGPRVVAVVGPGGAGKTTLAAGLVAAQQRADRPAVALALRPADGGEGLRRLAGEGVATVASGAEAAAHGTSGLAVLDTPGVSPRDGEAVRALAADLRAAGAAEVHLVLPATTGAHAARELLRALGDAGLTALAVSHADETEQLGTAVGLAIETGLPISFVGTTVPDGRELAEALLR